MALRIEVLSADELFQRTQAEPANKDLFTTRMVGDRKVRRLHYLNHDDARHQTQIVLYEGARIVGAAGLQINPWQTENVWVQHVSVEEAYRGKGFAAKLIEAVYAYAVDNKLKVEPSAFSALGQRLKHIFDRFDALHPQAACGQPHRDHF